MADYISSLNPSSDLSVTDAGGFQGASTMDTGDLRRKFNFGDQVSELSVAQDPFFRFVSKVGKKPTDDSSFKFTEKRNSWHKRYVYLEAFGAGFATALTTAADTQDAQGNTFYGKFGTDFKNTGNLTNIYGASISYKVGDANTKPSFLLPDQLIKVPVADNDNTSDGESVTDYQVVRITSVVDNGNYVNVTGKVVKGVSSGKYYMGVPASIEQAASGTTTASEESLAPYKCYVVGSAHQEGSGYPETWKDQPYSTGYGYTQIWKTSMAMTNTARATVLKYEPNEWARVWKDKLVEHKYDIEQSLLFGTQYQDTTAGNQVQYTQGAVDFISNYGNTFSLATATKTADDFLDDLSAYMDPRYNNSKATVFFVNTGVYNWLHKLGGYFSNNLNINSNFSADLAVTGRKKVLGLDATNITTPFGDMNVVRNIHLDGTNVKMLGVNMKYAKYRPLVGNGVNRDTSVYVGVQTLENSGVDRRVDLILTEAGMEWSMPECHAIWS